MHVMSLKTVRNAMRRLQVVPSVEWLRELVPDVVRDQGYFRLKVGRVRNSR
jgi:hypothetical protein